MIAGTRQNRKLGQQNTTENMIGLSSKHSEIHFCTSVGEQTPHLTHVVLHTLSV